MPWTESRSREEWLAEVQRRGERIRRRRQFAIAVVGVFALVLPLSAVAGFLSAGPPGTVELSAAGTVPGAERPTAATTDAQATDTTPVDPGGAASAPAPAEEPRPPANESPTTTAEVHGRVAVINGSTEPRTSPAVPPADDPVVRPPSTPTSVAQSGPSGDAGGAPRSTANSGGPVSSASPPPPDPALADCPPKEVRVTVVTDKATYAPGEVISGSSTLENRSGSACRLPTRAFFRIREPGGHDVGSFPYTTEYRTPVRAEPGKTFISGFTWDQQDCAATCVQVPPGPYTVSAAWTESGHYIGETSFQIGA